MKNYKIPENIDKWDFENSFYLTCENNRISNFLSHLELYKMILGLPGDIIEFGVDDIVRSGLVKEYLLAKLELNL